MREQSSKKIKNQKAITLITLVVTIGILLILSAVTITTIKNDGIIDQAQNVTDRVKVQSLIDEIKMDILRKQTIENKEITEEELNGILSQYGTVKDGVLHVDDLNCDIPISDIWTSTTQLETQITSSNIGNYVKYNVSYTDMYTQKEYKTTDGWKYIGDDSTGNHLIISTGIPGTYGFYPDIRADSESENSYQQTIDRFKNKFEDFTLNINSSGSERDQIIFKKIGNYTSGKTVGTVFKSGNNAAIAVHNIRYDEINTVLQSSSSKAEALFYLDNPYWITPVDESYNGLLHIVDYDGGKTFQDYSQTNLGIRPVVVLSASTKLVRNQNGIWEIK